MKKKISLMILTMIFCLGFTTAAFAGNYFCVMTNKPDNANKIEATTGKLKVANDPTVGRSSDSCGWVMIGGQSSTQYVQLGWLKKVDSYGVVSKYHFAEGNDDNWFGPDVIYGSSYSINSTYTYSIVESTLTEGKYYFYINGSSIGGYLTEDFVPGGVQSGEEVLGDISSTRISGTTINKASGRRKLCTNESCDGGPVNFK